MFIVACECDRIDLVRELLKYPEVDPSAQNNKAIISACVRHNTEDHPLIQLLLKEKRVNPKGVSISNLQSQN